MTSLRKAVYVVDPVIIALLGVSVLATRPPAVDYETTPVRLQQPAPDAVGRTDMDTPTITLSTGFCPASILVEGRPLALDDVENAFDGAAPSQITIRTDSVTAALIARLKRAGVSRVGLTFDEHLAKAPGATTPRTDAGGS